MASKALDVRAPKGVDLAVEWIPVTRADALRTDWTEEEAVAVQESLVKAADTVAGVGSGIMLAQAYAMHGVWKSGLVGAGKRWESQGDYGRECGVGKSQVSKLIAIGRGLAIGVKPNTADYTNLVAAVNSQIGDSATRTAVKDALKGDDVDALKSALKAAKAVTPGKPTKAQPARGAGGTTTPTPAAAPTDDNGAALPTMGLLLQQVPPMQRAILALSDREEQDRVLDAVVAMVAFVRGVRDAATVEGTVVAVTPDTSGE